MDHPKVFLKNHLKELRKVFHWSYFQMLFVWPRPFWLHHCTMQCVRAHRLWFFRAHLKDMKELLNMLAKTSTLLTDLVWRRLQNNFSYLFRKFGVHIWLYPRRSRSRSRSPRRSKPAVPINGAWAASACQLRQRWVIMPVVVSFLATRKILWAPFQTSI